MFNTLFNRCYICGVTLIDMTDITAAETIQMIRYQEELPAMRRGMELVGSKWKLILLRYLGVHHFQTNNFKKIVRSVHGISAKVLTKELRDLEAAGMITRTITSTRPLAVEYAITDYGRTLLPVAEALAQWCVEYAGEETADAGNPQQP